MFLFYLFIFFGIAILIYLIFAEFKIRNLRQQGIYPEKGKATMQDVTRLLSEQREIYAIRAYREIHGVSLKKAKAEIEKLASS